MPDTPNKIPLTGNKDESGIMKRGSGARIDMEGRTMMNIRRENRDSPYLISEEQ